MKDFVFVSDFDGTLTDRDFYKMITDEYLKEECVELYKDWRNKRIKDVEYLGYVFNNMGRNEEEILEDIMKINLDPYALEFINNVKAANGDFVIVSAGTSYYIDIVLKKNKIDDIEVYSNKGVYKDKGIHFVFNKESQFYSDIYGIDKLLVVKKLQQNYKKVFYAGDSEPDLKPALSADVVFARGSLIEMLQEAHKDFIKFENFSDIWEKLKPHLNKE